MDVLFLTFYEPSCEMADEMAVEVPDLMADSLVEELLPGIPHWPDAGHRPAA